MTNEELTGYASRWPGVTTDVRWGADLVLSVGGKMFCARAVEAAADAPLSFKVAPDRFLELTDRPGFVPAPYLARAGWVQATPGPVGEEELRALVRASYELVRARLSRTLQRAFAD